MGAEMAPRAGQWRPTGLHLCFLCFLCPRCAGAGEQQQEGPRIIAEYDLAYLEHMPLHQSWEHLHAVVAIAGIVNRDGPVLFTPYTAHDTQADQRWRSHLTGTGQWLANATFSPIRSCPSGACIAALVRRFRSSLKKGAVVYDPAVPATSNVASTIAGVESLVPIVNGGALHAALLSTGLLPIAHDLTGKFTGSRSGSAKADAYLWAVDEYLRTGRANASFLPVSAATVGFGLTLTVDRFCEQNYVDAWVTQQQNRFDGPRSVNLTLSTTMLTNHDYFIAHRGFFWDLAVYPDEHPSDDPHSPLGVDRRTVEVILGAAYNQTRGKRMIKVAGQGPHAWKYSNEGLCGKHCKHATVENEDEMISLFTSYNAYNDADDVELSTSGVSDGTTVTRTIIPEAQAALTFLGAIVRVGRWAAGHDCKLAVLLAPPPPAEAQAGPAANDILAAGEGLCRQCRARGAEGLCSLVSRRLGRSSVGLQLFRSVLE